MVINAILKILDFKKIFLANEQNRNPIVVNFDE